jgi:magnesium transporter
MFDSRPTYTGSFQRSSENINRRPKTRERENGGSEDEDVVDERAPLISSSNRSKSSGAAGLGYGVYGGDVGPVRRRSGSQQCEERQTTQNDIRSTGLGI